MKPILAKKAQPKIGFNWAMGKSLFYGIGPLRTGARLWRLWRENKATPLSAQMGCQRSSGRDLCRLPEMREAYNADATMGVGFRMTDELIYLAAPYSDP